jgi:hypothetical protein
VLLQLVLHVNFFLLFFRNATTSKCGEGESTSFTAQPTSMMEYSPRKCLPVLGEEDSSSSDSSHHLANNSPISRFLALNAGNSAAAKTSSPTKKLTCDYCPKTYTTAGNWWKLHHIKKHPYSSVATTAFREAEAAASSKKTSGDDDEENDCDEEEEDLSPGSDESREDSRKGEEEEVVFNPKTALPGTEYSNCVTECA